MGEPCTRAQAVPLSRVAASAHGDAIAVAEVAAKVARRPRHDGGWAGQFTVLDDPPGANGREVVSPRIRRGSAMDLRSFPAYGESRFAVSASPPRMRAV